MITRSRSKSVGNACKSQEMPDEVPPGGTAQPVRLTNRLRKSRNEIKIIQKQNGILIKSPKFSKSDSSNADNLNSNLENYLGSPKNISKPEVKIRLKKRDVGEGKSDIKNIDENFMSLRTRNRNNSLVGHKRNEDDSVRNSLENGILHSEVNNTESCKNVTCNMLNKLKDKFKLKEAVVLLRDVNEASNLKSNIKSKRVERNCNFETEEILEHVKQSNGGLKTEGGSLKHNKIRSKNKKNSKMSSRKNESDKETEEEEIITSIESKKECSENDRLNSLEKSPVFKKCVVSLTDIKSPGLKNGKKCLSPMSRALLSVSKNNGGIYYSVYGSDTEEKKNLTLLAEGYNFSELVHAFKNEHKDSNMNGKITNNNCITECDEEIHSLEEYSVKSRETSRNLNNKSLESQVKDTTVGIETDNSIAITSFNADIKTQTVSESSESELDQDKEEGNETDNSIATTSFSADIKTVSEYSESELDEDTEVGNETDDSIATTYFNADTKTQTVSESSESDLEQDKESNSKFSFSEISNESLEQDVQGKTLGGDINTDEESDPSELEDILESRKCTVSPSQNEVDLSLTSVEDFQIELIKKELAKRGIKETSPDSEDSSNKKMAPQRPSTSPVSSSPKKMKPLKEKNKPKGPNPGKAKKSTAENYIPLEVSGPTKFAVATLDNLTPSQSHDCRHFKEKMLFGDRVKRFSSAELRTLKLKRKAAGLFSPADK